MGTARMAVGKLGEDAAVEFLEKRGHTVLERNWRCSHYELDIITFDKKGIHIVEVKTRVAPVAALPEENVNALKKRRMVAAAKAYLNSHDFKKKKKSCEEVFFDVIGVTFDREKTNIEYFPQAFIPLYI